jgi:hypothetical protein
MTAARTAVQVRRKQLVSFVANTRFRLCLLRVINSQNRHRVTTLQVLVGHHFVQPARRPNPSTNGRNMVTAQHPEDHVLKLAPWATQRRGWTWEEFDVVRKS